jgi:hypothetical protein
MYNNFIQTYVVGGDGEGGDRNVSVYHQRQMAANIYASGYAMDINKRKTI